MLPYTPMIGAGFLAFAIGVSSIAESAEPDWPGWLGAKRNGWVAGVNPPAAWPKQLKSKWSLVVGAGYGTPLVTGDNVYQHARLGDNEVLWRIDLNSGKVHWRKSYPAPFKMGGGGERHGKGPKSSPVLADGRVFTISITGVLSAWNANSGKLLWRRDYSNRFKKTHPYWGVATSPIVDANRVITHFGTDEYGALIALDVASGKEVWSQGNDGASYSSPLLEELDGVKQIVEWNHRALVGVESASGQKLWEFAFPHEGHNQNMPTPTYHQGRIILGGENRGVLSLHPQRRDGEWNVRQEWRQDKVALDMSSAVINDGLLFGFSHYGKGRLFCLNPKTGEVLWQGPGRTGENAAFLSLPGHVIALLNNGRLRVIKSQSTGLEIVADYPVAETSAWAPPVLLKDAMLIKDHHTLRYWSLK